MKYLNIPGLRNSNEYHWQTAWEKKYPDQFIRVQQDNWEEPNKEEVQPVKKMEVQPVTKKVETQPVTKKGKAPIAKKGKAPIVKKGKAPIVKKVEKYWAYSLSFFTKNLPGIQK